MKRSELKAGRYGFRGEAPGKYGAQPVTIDGHSFPSTLEAAYWIELMERQARGEISELAKQVVLRIPGETGSTLARLIVDFAYVEGGEQVYADTKGLVLGPFKLKAALLKDRCGIVIRIVKTKDVASWAKATAREVRDMGIKGFETRGPKA